MGFISNLLEYLENRQIQMCVTSFRDFAKRVSNISLANFMPFDIWNARFLESKTALYQQVNGELKYEWLIIALNEMLGEKQFQ